MTYPKNDSEVSNLIGKVIQFNDNVEMSEIDFDSGMKARVVNASITDPNEVFKLELDFSEFEEYNKKFMKHNYYDKNSEPTLRWCDTRYYPTNCKCYDYFGFNCEGSDCFTVISDTDYQI